MDAAHNDGEAGTTLVEVLVSALLVALIGVGVFAGLDSATATSGSLRARSIGGALVQQDQERLRAMRPSDLPSLSATPRTANVQGVPFSVSSTAQWQQDPDPSPACAGDPPATDYLRIVSDVRWPRRTNAAQTDRLAQDTIVAAPRPAAAGTGSVLVQVVGGGGAAANGAHVTLGSVPSRADTTSGGGCIQWKRVAAGQPAVTIDEPGWVTPTGQTQSTQTPTVSDQQTTVVGPVSYDRAGIVDTTFRAGTTGPTGTWDRVTFANAGATRYFGTAGTYAGTISSIGGDGTPGSPGLFPFATAYTVYAGDCAGKAPVSGQGDVVTVTPGSRQSLEVHIPFVDLTVRDRLNSGAAWAPVNGARVTFRRTNAANPPCPDETVGPYATAANGKALSFPALPYGLWTACAQVTYGASTYRRTANFTLATPGGWTNTIDFDRSSLPPVGTCP